jgi:hypothetical protein
LKIRFQREIFWKKLFRMILLKWVLKKIGYLEINLIKNYYQINHLLSYHRLRGYLHKRPLIDYLNFIKRNLEIINWEDFYLLETHFLFLYCYLFLLTHFFSKSIDWILNYFLKKIKNIIMFNLIKNKIISKIIFYF